ncbi:hypothetical protein D8Y20_08550 [Mariprofundus sp. EBB-1]|nr:hypothetical protein D8Y20_08550 [Mariprofundus sp. EBB-1]
MCTGGINKEILQDVVGASDLLELPSSNATAPSLLPIEIAHYIRNYMENHSVNSGAPDCCAFVNIDQLRKTASNLDTSKHISFNIDYNIDIQGKIFLTTPSLGAAYSINTAITSIGDIDHYIHENNLEDSPTVIVSLSQNKIHWYPDGIEDDSSLKQYEIHYVQYATEAEIDIALKHFHETQVLTPSCSKGIWSKPEKYIPGENLEQTIQELLKVALSFYFDKSLVAKEGSSQVGRYDLLIEQKLSNHNFHRYALLELKAIKSYAYSESDNPTQYTVKYAKEALVDGVDQADIYRNKWDAKLGYLCCYDARKDASKEIMDEVSGVADDKNVILRHYILYNSSKNFRRSQPGSAYSTVD